MSFVGYKQVSSVDDLKNLMEHYADPLPSYYFLRWAHCVSGIVSKLPQEFPSPEGQLFNAELELRWKRQGHDYSVLLLSKTLEVAEGFTAIPENRDRDWQWQTQDRAANFNGKTDARFPKGFTYPDNLTIHQRYFLNAQTATVHFVALTVKPSK
jgi:hypothetical protein